MNLNIITCSPKTNKLSNNKPQTHQRFCLFFDLGSYVAQTSFSVAEDDVGALISASPSPKLGLQATKCFE